MSWDVAQGSSLLSTAWEGCMKLLSIGRRAATRVGLQIQRAHACMHRTLRMSLIWQRTRYHVGQDLQYVCEPVPVIHMLLCLARAGCRARQRVLPARGHRDADHARAVRLCGGPDHNPGGPGRRAGRARAPGRLAAGGRGGGRGRRRRRPGASCSWAHMYQVHEVGNPQLCKACHRGTN